MFFKIGEAAKQIGIHPSTLRDLENRGLISIRRNWSGHRVYTEEEISQIREKIFPSQK